MTDFILHHFDISPFAEKIRKVFGIKGAQWRSVPIPPAMPKPDLMPLTGGYRKTPVLQIGADVYCDTKLIARVINEILPRPPLFAAGPLVAFALQDWSDGVFFPPGAALSLHENAAHIPAPLRQDREDYFSFLDFSRFEIDAPHFRSQFRAAVRLIDDQLADGRRFVHGDAPQWTDVGAYFNLWMARGNIPSAVGLLEGMTRVSAWRDRMDAFGEGARTELSAAEALDIARTAAPRPCAQSKTTDPSGAQAGDAVTVTPTDHGRVPVEGILGFVDDAEIIVLRRDARVGEIAVHFPRAGYRVDRGR